MENVQLKISKTEASRELTKRIAEGKKIMDTNYIDMDEARLDEMRSRRDIWNNYNVEYLKRIFSDDSIANEYERDLGGVVTAGAPLEKRREYTDRTIEKKITRLKFIISRLSLIPKEKTNKIEPDTQNIIIDKKNMLKEKWYTRYWWLVMVPILVFIIEQWLEKKLSFSK